MAKEKSFEEKISKRLHYAIKKRGFNVSEDEIMEKLEQPPNYDMGDYAFPCFFLAKIFKLPPKQIALDIREEIGEINGISETQTKGPYINFFRDRVQLSLKILQEIDEKKDNFGMSNIGKNNKIVLEFSSPNIAKPFGIGHLRSTIIGNSLSKIYEFLGYKVIKINYLGDWGTQFGKLILGFKKFGDRRKYGANPTEHLLEVYVKANKKEYEEQARNEFKKLESGDKENTKLWKEFREKSLKEFKGLYKKMNIEFDEYSGESMLNDKIGEVLKKLKEKKLIKRNQGALIVDLKENDLGVCLIQKSDGTTIYSARDMAAAIKRHEKYGFEKMYYEVGNEQKLHFQQFFKVLDLMGYPWASNLGHVGHGLYLGTDGKKFSTRKGKTVFMQDILDDTIEEAKKEIKKRGPNISKKELKERSEKVALASIFYGDLKNYRENNMIFNLKRFVSFEGNTGPYLLYSYARANSIINKITKKIPKNEYKHELKEKQLDEKEIQLIMKFSEFTSKIQKAHDNLNPAEIANYAFQIAQTFNEFYHECPVLNSEKESFRLELVRAFKQVLKNSLNMLGIKPLEKM